MCAGVLGQVPKPDAAAPVAADDLALIRVDNHIVNRGAVVIAPAYSPGTSIPDLDGAILGARHHPFAVTVECYASDVACMALKNRGGSGVRGTDVEQLDCVVARGGEESLVGGNAQAVDLRVGMLDGAGADSRESLPEPERRVSTIDDRQWIEHHDWQEGART